VAGDAHGRVKALFNYKGEKIQKALPGEPVEILGFDKPPPAGELGRVVENDRLARELATRRAERLRREQLATQRTSGVSLENLFEQMQTGEVADLNLVVKGDVVGSVEAVVSELSKFEHSEVRLNVIHQGVGAITQNDIMLASASDALSLRPPNHSSPDPCLPCRAMCWALSAEGVLAPCSTNSDSLTSLISNISCSRLRVAPSRETVEISLLYSTNL